jgi:uncharacterized membrane protein YkvA (DUF1232 family)
MAKKSQGSTSLGVLGELIQNGRLAWRLLFDRRVPTLLKMVVPGVMGAYLLMPIDLFPDLVPILGQLDDLAVLAIAVKLFVQLAPQDVVEELRTGIVPAGQEAPAGAPASRPEDVVDAPYRVIE